MHLVIVDNENLVQTHIVVDCQGTKQGMAKNVEINGELVRAYVPVEELFFNRSLFVFRTPRQYGVYLVQNDIRDYRYNKEDAIEKIYEWIKYDQFSAGFNNTFVMLDSENFMITVFVKSNTKIFIEREDGYEETVINNLTNDGATIFKLV